MAKFNMDLPGCEVTAKLEFRDGCAYSNVNIEINNVRRLVWYCIRTQYKVKWYQWPYVLWIVLKLSILHKLGRWPDGPCTFQKALDS